MNKLHQVTEIQNKNQIQYYEMFNFFEAFQ